jgi:Tfp pilus assembly protein PilE
MRGRGFGFVSLLLALLVVGGIYYYYVRSMPTAAKDTAVTQAISITGVQSDLLQIANTERQFIVQNDRCGSLDELISSGTLSMSRTERNGYVYSVDCSGTGFTVIARHAPPPPDVTGVRYPTVSVDQTLRVRQSD